MKALVIWQNYLLDPLKKSGRFSARQSSRNLNDGNPPLTASTIVPPVVIPEELLSLSPVDFLQVPLVSQFYLPVKPGSFATFFLSISGKGDAKDKTFYFKDTKSNTVVFKAVKHGSISSTTFQIFVLEYPQQIASSTSNMTRLKFVTVLNGAHENSCMIYKSNIIKSSVTRNFEGFIPKIGKNFPASNTPTICNDKENSFKFYPKAPTIKRGVPVLKFGGKVKLDSTKNHILNCDDFPDETIMLFGKVEKGLFVCEFRFPLTPFQAFSLCLPHFV